MHQGTCVTRVPWCIPGSLTSGFLWSRWRGKRYLYSRRMRSPQFFVSVNRPKQWFAVDCCQHVRTESGIQYISKTSKPRDTYLINTLSVRRNGRHFADNILNALLAMKLCELRLKLLLRVQLVDIMIWCRLSDRPLSQSMMVRLLTHISVTRHHWAKCHHWLGLWLVRKQTFYV